MAIPSISQGSSTLLSADKKSSEVKQADDLEDQVKKNIEASVDYQIIKKTLFKKQASTEESKAISIKSTDKKESPANFQTDTLSISQQAVSLSSNNESAVSRQEIEANERASLSISRTVGEEEIKKSDPLALDLNGDGLQTTGVKNGVMFDINGDGKQEKTSFITGGDAFLAYDRNGNGVIDGAKELFGDSNGYQHGFAELAAYDDNQDGKIDQSDAIYEQLQLFSMDKNGQHLSSLHESNIASINVGYSEHNQAINQYDTIAQIGQFEYKNGQQGVAGDLLLAYKK
ncbi:MAG: hypothetical protein KZQ83_19750 [gamma proteobacterium symbiont of Taylorina sp.]|nr:hypothetical protein [gamma proteobacterium symbiont of Taylorina sp.]